MNKIDRAGLIPYFVNADGDYEMFFMKPSDPEFGGPDFQIAKGKVDPGETPKEAAVREAKEELGLFEGNIVGDVHYIDRFLGRTDVYVCEIKDQDLFGIPHYETGETCWMTESQFNESGRSLHRPVVQAAMRYITNVNK